MGIQTLRFATMGSTQRFISIRAQLRHTNTYQTCNTHDQNCKHCQCGTTISNKCDFELISPILRLFVVVVVFRVKLVRARGRWPQNRFPRMLMRMTVPHQRSFIPIQRSRLKNYQSPQTQSNKRRNSINTRLHDFLIVLALWLQLIA